MFLIQEAGMDLKIKIDEAKFTAPDLGEIAGVDAGLVKAWLRRGLIKPTKVIKREVRNQPLFSVIEIFKARLLRALSDSLDIPPSFLADFIADEGWMWGIARLVDRYGKPLPMMMGVTKVKGRLQYYTGSIEEIVERFGDRQPYLVIPAYQIFAAVYSACVKNYEEKEKEARDA